MINILLAVIFVTLFILIFCLIVMNDTLLKLSKINSRTLRFCDNSLIKIECYLENIDNYINRKELENGQKSNDNSTKI